MIDYNELRKRLEYENTINNSKSELKKVEDLIIEIEGQLNNLGTKENSLEIVKKNNTIINKLFNNKKIKERIKIAEKDVDEFVKLHGSKEEIQTKLNDLYEKKRYYETLIKSMDSSKSFDNNLVEMNEDGILVIDADKHNNVDISYGQEGKLNNDEFMLVHSTGHFPDNHQILSGYDGNKIDKENTSSETVEFEYEGVRKSFPNYSTRRTTHFILNSVVQDHGFGKFGSEYIVLENAKNHSGEIRRKSAGDTWIPHSVEISDASILMVRHDVYDKLTEEQKNMYKIIIYKGDKKRAVELLLNSMGYSALEYNINDTGHSLSSDIKIEGNLKARNIVMSYINNYKDYSKEDFSISSEMMSKMFDVWFKGHGEGKNSKMIWRDDEKVNNKIIELCKEKNIDPNLLNFYIKMGITYENGVYKSLQYEQIYNLYEYFDNEEINVDFINNYIESQHLQIIQQNINNSSILATKTNNDVSNMKFEDINKLENLDYSRNLQIQLNQVINSINGLLHAGGANVSFTENGLKINLTTDYNNLTNYANEEFKFYPTKECVSGNDKWKEVTFIIDCKGLTYHEIIDKVKNYVHSVNNRLSSSISKSEQIEQLKQYKDELTNTQKINVEEVRKGL